MAMVQAALARQLENDEEGPLSSRRPNGNQPEPGPDVVSPTLSFTDENGSVNSGSQGSTSSGHLPVSGCTRAPCIFMQVAHLCLIPL